LDDFAHFVNAWLGSNLIPLEAGYDFSVESWIVKTNYSEKRKAALLLNYEDTFRQKYSDKIKCKSFIKDEFYDSVKYARTINSRSDWFKVHSGPLFKAIESVLFKRPEFIKYVPVKDRPEYMLNFFGKTSGNFSCSDFKSFEGSFVPKMIRACEAQLYDYMLAHNPVERAKMKTIVDVLCGRNVLQFKNFRGQVRGVRMSGEMCTSLGNGFTNLMLVKYFLDKTGNEGVSIFEGDDGIHLTKYPLKDPMSFFASLGFNLDFKIHDNIYESKFCGQTFDHCKNVQIDCKKALINLCWIKGGYRNATKNKLLSLLKAKTMSLLFRAPNCPVVSSFASWVYRSIEGRYAINSFDSNWMRNDVKTMLSNFKYEDININLDSRVLYEKVYGVSIELQLELENYFNSLQGLSLLSHPALNDLYGPTNFMLNDMYVKFGGANDSVMVRPINDQNQKSEEENHEAKSPNANHAGKCYAGCTDPSPYVKAFREASVLVCP